MREKKLFELENVINVWNDTSNWVKLFVYEELQSGTMTKLTEDMEFARYIIWAAGDESCITGIFLV